MPEVKDAKGNLIAKTLGKSMLILGGGYAVSGSDICVSKTTGGKTYNISLSGGELSSDIIDLNEDKKEDTNVNSEKDDSKENDNKQKDEGRDSGKSKPTDTTASPRSEQEKAGGTSEKDSAREKTKPESTSDDAGRYTQ